MVEASLFSPPLFSFHVSAALFFLFFSQSAQPLLSPLSPPQRCSACCSRTCWCSCRSKMTRWSSNATARVTSPCRRASRCWVLLSSWTQSSCVRWPQVSRHAASLTCCHSHFHRGSNLLQPKGCSLFFSLPDPKAFYVIFTWDSGAQIYELVAQSAGERKL